MKPPGAEDALVHSTLYQNRKKLMLIEKLRREFLTIQRKKSLLVRMSDFTIISKDKEKNSVSSKPLKIGLHLDVWTEGISIGTGLFKIEPTHQKYSLSVENEKEENNN